MARELGPKGVHVAHVLVDGMVDNVNTRFLLFFFEGWIEMHYMMSYKCSVPKTFIQYLLESFSQTLIRRFFTAKHPEIAAKFEEKEKEDGLIKPDQVKSFSMMN